MPFPVFLFVPGAWHTPAYFDPLRSALSSAGYRSEAVTLASVAPAPLAASAPSAPPADADAEADLKAAVEAAAAGEATATAFAGDVAVVASALGRILDAGDDAVVVAHSYGGMPATEAVGKVVSERRAEGKTGARVRRVVYVAAFAPKEDQPCSTVTAGAVDGPNPPTPHLEIELPWIKLNALAPAVFYHDVPEPHHTQYVSLLRPFALASFGVPTSATVPAAWRLVPSTYVFTRQDRPLPLPYQEFMVRSARKEQEARVAEGREGEVLAFADGEGEEGKGLGEVYLDCGHTPFLSNTEEMRDVLVRTAKA